ncbi:MAG: hypothetical protein ACI8RE_000827 [Ilumatobacter sp.]|jgi:hypothetical protein
MRNSSRIILALAATISMTAAACGSDSSDAVTVAAVEVLDENTEALADTGDRFAGRR